MSYIDPALSANLERLHYTANPILPRSQAQQALKSFTCWCHRTPQWQHCSHPAWQGAACFSEPFSISPWTVHSFPASFHLTLPCRAGFAVSTWKSCLDQCHRGLSQCPSFWGAGCHHFTSSDQGGPSRSEPSTLKSLAMVLSPYC